MCIVAIKDIPQECTLFTIPRDAIINVETSGLPKKLPKVFDPPIEEEEDEDDGNEPLDSWGSLILVMLYEYLQGDASRWKPYFDILPTTFDTPIFWTEDELEELKGTCLTPEKIGKKESDDMLRTRIVPVVLENASVFYAEGAPQLSEEELLTLAHRIGSTIMAYAFDLDNKEEQSDDEEDGWVEDHDGQTMLGMVPMADVLNANADFNVSIWSIAFYANLTNGPRHTLTTERVLRFWGFDPMSSLEPKSSTITGHFLLQSFFEDTAMSPPSTEDTTWSKFHGSSSDQLSVLS